MIFAATSRVFWPLYAPGMRWRRPLAGGKEPLPRCRPQPAPYFEIASAATGYTNTKTTTTTTTTSRSSSSSSSSNNKSMKSV